MLDIYLHIAISIVSLVLVIQGLEYSMLQKAWSKEGVWSWQILASDYQSLPDVLQKFLNHLMQDKIYYWLCWAQAFIAMLNISLHSTALSGLLFLFLLIHIIRWRGFYNGGSDAMTMLVLVVCIFADLFKNHEGLQKGIFLYLAIQAILSYFIAGIVKAKNPQWWNGKALQQILLYSNYSVPASVKKLAMNSKISKMSSVLIIIFELSFPLAAINMKTAAFYCAAAVVFHIFNFYALGLNRFTFAWMASYPAIFFLASRAY